MKKLICLCASTLLLNTMGRDGEAATTGAKQSATDSDANIVHVLNRVAFGPRPGDIERVRQMGVQQYINEQLNPQNLVDPVASDERFQNIKQNSVRLIAKFQAMRKRQQELKKTDNLGDEQKDAAKRSLKQFYSETEGAYKAARLERAINSPRQLEEVMTDFWYNHFNVFTGKGLDRVLCGPYEESRRSALTCLVASEIFSVPHATTRQCFFIWITGKTPHPEPQEQKAKQQA